MRRIWGQIDSFIGIGQDLMIHDLEDYQIERFNGKKRQRIMNFSSRVSKLLDFAEKNDELLLTYQNDLSGIARGRSTDSNDNHVLECSWVGKLMDYKEASAHDKTL